jgi:uncharacterized repeat protein (TIGR01451 family)
VDAVNLKGTVNSIGYWYQVGNYPTVAKIDSTSPNTATASNLDIGTYEFVYAVDTGGSCESRDTMFVSIYDAAGMADAGPDQELCDATIFYMAANSVDPGNTGKWSVLSGPSGGNFVDDTDPTTEFHNAVPGVYVFEWTVSNQECSNADQVRITNYAYPTVPDAGPDQTHVCDSVAVMAGNTPQVGVGIWSIDTATIPPGKTPVIQSPVQPQTTITDLVPDTWPGTYTFVWTITNGVCDTLRDSVQVTVYEPPTKADAGQDVTLCDTDSTLTNANQITVGTGIWSQGNGNNVTFDDVNNPITYARHLAYDTTQLVWTSDNNNGCTSADTALVINYKSPTIADASATATELCLYDPMTLEGNTPTVGTGIWTQISGTHVNILNPTSPVTDVLGVVADTYEFVWTITNGTCLASADTVQIVVNPIPSQALAGPDQELCDATSATLDGNSPTGGSIGTWTLYDGPTAVTFDDPTNPAATVSNLSPGDPNKYVLVWTHSQGICTKSDTMNILTWSQPSIAVAGQDQVLCNAATTTLSANLPTIGTGKWTLASGPNHAVIADPDTNVTDVSNLINGDYYFVYTVTHGPVCTPSKDTVKISNYSDITITGPADTTICKGGAITISVVASGGQGSYDYQWQMSTTDCNGSWTNVGNNVDTLDTQVLNDTTFYRCIVSNEDGNCDPDTSRCAVVNVTEDPSFTYQSDVDTICKGGEAIFEVAVTGGTGTFSYQWQQADDCNGPWSDVTAGTGDTAIYNTGKVDVIGNHYYRCIIAQCGAGCDTLISDCMELTVNPDPVITNQPQEAIICSGTDYTLGVTVTGGSGHFRYRWAESPNGVDQWHFVQSGPDSTYTTPPLTTTTYYRVRVIDSINGCNNLNSDTVAVHVPHIGDQPLGTTMCNGGTHQMSIEVFADTATLSYQWQRSDSDNSYNWIDKGSDTSSYTTDPLLTGTYYYRCVVSVTNPTCADLITDTVTVEVVNDPVYVQGPQSDTTCYLSTLYMETEATGGTGAFSYQWQVYENGTFVDVGTNDPSYTTPPLIDDTSYRVLITQSGVGCDPLTSDTALITVNNVDGGDIDAEQTICEGSTPSPLTSVTDATGDGAITYQWQESTDGNTFANITDSTRNEYVPEALTADRWYVRVATSTMSPPVNACQTNSDTIHIWVNNITAGTIGLDQIICEGSAPATLTGTVPVDHDGAVSYLWEESPDGITYTDASGINTNVDYSPGPLTEDTWYRRIDYSTLNGITCSKITNTVLITVNNLTPGSIAADDTICAGDTPNLITSVADATGDGTISYKWQTSASDNLFNFTDIASATGLTYQPGALSQDAWYRRVAISTLNNQSCSKYSDTVKVTVNNIDPGEIGQDQEVCYEGAPDPFTSITDASGDSTITYQWEKSLDNITFNIISGATSSDYTDNTLLTDTTWYRRVAYSTMGTYTCSAVSDTIEVSVVPDPTIDTQPVGTTLCSGSDYTLSVVASNGTPHPLHYQWQISTSDNPYNFTDIANATNSQYTTSPLTSDTWYRVIVSATGNGCNDTISDTAVVIVNNLVAGTISGVDTICAGSVPNIITGTDATGDGIITYQWTKSIDGSNYTDISGATSKDYAPGALTQDTWYMRMDKSDLNGLVCTVFTNEVKITVNNVSAGVVESDQEVCAISQDPDPFTESTPASGDGNLTYQWQSSSDNVNFTDISGATAAIYDPPTLTDTTWFRRIVTSTLGTHTCSAISDTLVINANDCPAIDLVKTGTVDDGGDGRVDAGDFINYTFRIENTGNVTLTDVDITDQLISVNGGPIQTFPAGTVDNTTFTGVYTITQADIDAGLFINTAIANGTSPKNTVVRDTSSYTTYFGQHPSVEVVKTATKVNGKDMPAKYSAVGDIISYRITYRNDGNVSVHNPLVNDPYATSGPNYFIGDDGNLILDPGETWIYDASHVVTQADIDTARFINTATGTGNADSIGGTVPVSDHDTSQVFADQKPDLTIVKTGSPDTVTSAGETINYTIVVTNTGNLSLTNVVATDTLPDGSVIALTNPAEGNQPPNDTIDVGESWTYTIT